ncbi:sulfurtransferase [Bacillus salitolerans]|uniref:Sulfurtransferase n=1 Tax=Bacillus salitolerans TaxID=1437434 RepID=A0ABW4LTQ7_9BACI
MKYIKSMDWLLSHRNDESVRIVDCRFQLGKKDAGYQSYLDDHIENAVYLDLEKDLSGQVKEHGGRHPLPNLKELSQKLGELGISKDITVIAYDDQNGAMASRLWWLLQYIGHSQSFVLNGSYSLWKDRGYPTSNQIPSFQKHEFIPVIQPQLLASVSNVQGSINSKDINIIDSREERRYLGIEEPIDPVAGHIPGAKHAFWLDGFEQNGLWKDTASQQSRFSNVEKEKPIIVYCGSGVTACPNVLALKEAGFEDVKLYIGSWSDWISYPDNPIEKE